MQRLIPERIQLVVRLEGGPAPVNADAGQLSQVLLNLVVNAQHAIEAHGTVTLATHSSGDSVHIAVADTGVGIPPDIKERIFEPFFTTRPLGEGSGLGLATTHGIVDEHGGRIEVDSEPGAGSTFHVVLPLTTQRVAASIVPADPGPEDGDEVILVVEDEPQVRRVTCETLVSLGYRVRESANGLEALQELESSPEVALVLTDVTMPELGGVELLARLAVERPGLPVLLMTGYARTPLNTEARSIAKPFRRQELAVAVREMLGDAAGENP
jgi:two-component system cell cycle sensor histidine kinase/response regulator CckA